MISWFIRILGNAAPCPALAALTYWLRLQVVTYISGRTFHRSTPASLDTLDIPSSWSNVWELPNTLGCGPSLALCLAATVKEELEEEEPEEGVGGEVVQGVLEWAATGAIGGPGHFPK